MDFQVSKIRHGCFGITTAFQRIWYLMFRISKSWFHMISVVFCTGYVITQSSWILFNIYHSTQLNSMHNCDPGVKTYCIASKQIQIFQTKYERHVNIWYTEYKPFRFYIVKQMGERCMKKMRLTNHFSSVLKWRGVTLTIMESSMDRESIGFGRYLLYELKSYYMELFTFIIVAYSWKRRLYQCIDRGIFSEIGSYTVHGATVTVGQAGNGWLAMAPCEYESQFRHKLYDYWECVA